MMLTKSEIEYMRRTIARTFVTKVIRLHKVATNDGRGGRQVTWEPAESFKGRISTVPPGPMQRVEYGKVISDQAFLLSYPHDVQIKPEDRILIGDKTYEVTNVFEDSSFDLHGRAHLRLIS